MYDYAFSAKQDVVELAGFTSRVSTMLEVFEDCSRGMYARNVVTSRKSTQKRHSLTNAAAAIEFRDGVPVIKGTVIESIDGSIVLEDVSLFRHCTERSFNKDASRRFRS